MKDYFLPKTKSEGLNEYCEQNETLSRLLPPFISDNLLNLSFFQ